MEKELEKSFKNYVDLVYRNLKDKSRKAIKTPSKTILQLISNPDWEIKQKVGQFVESEEFLQLVKNSQNAFSEFKDIINYLVSISFSDYFGEDAGMDFYKDGIKGLDPNWFFAVYNFFCRSGFYQKIINRADLNNQDLFEQFCVAFQKKEFRTIYLAPLIGVDFSGKNMNFGVFQIRKFTEDELEKIFNNEINKVLYPEAFFDSKIGYWFIAVEDVETLSNKVYEINFYSDIIPRRYTHFPKKVEAALRSIILYDWRLSKFYDLNKEVLIKYGSSEKELKDLRDSRPHWLDKFEIPFVLKEDDNLLAFPENRKLTTSLFDKTRYRYQYLLSHDKEQTKNFKKFIVQTKKLIDGLELDSDELKYLDIAFGYMIKGFFSEYFEELLFNIIAIEALIGEKGKEITDKLRKRISMILGETEKERKKIREEFDELYDLRCQLVHGSKFKKPIYEDHLRKSRELTCKTLLWYLFCLNYFKNKSKRLSTRSDILALIDLEKGYIPIVKGFLSSLPKNFPNVPNWVKDS